MGETLSMREARARLAELADEAERLGQRFIITRRGRPCLVLLSADEFESWVETLEILADKALMRQLRGSARDASRKKAVSLESLRKRSRR